jgi:hypothetical protein
VRRPNSPPDGGGWVIGLASSALSFIKCGGPTGALLGPGNPVTASFGATLHREVLKTLRLRGHEVDDCDLYAERLAVRIAGAICARRELTCGLPHGSLVV